MVGHPGPRPLSLVELEELVEAYLRSRERVHEEAIEDIASVWPNVLLRSEAGLVKSGELRKFLQLRAPAQLAALDEYAPSRGGGR